MVLFDVLRSEKTLFSPEVSICGMLVSLDQQQGWRDDPLSMDEFAGCRYWFIFAAFDAILRHTLKNTASFLSAAAFALASPGQFLYLLCEQTGVVIATKSEGIISFLAPNFNFF